MIANLKFNLGCVVGDSCTRTTRRARRSIAPERTNERTDAVSPRMGTPQTQSHHQQQHANNATMRDHTAAQARAAQRLKELWKNVPLTPEQMTEVKRLVRLVPDLAAIGLVAPPAPLKLVPSNLEKVPAEERLATLQAFVDGFQYNHTGSTYFCLRKNRPLSAIIATAKQMARDRLPIKCLEATFLGLHITSGLDDWERIPVGFKTQVEPPDGAAR